MSTLVFVNPEISTQADGAQSSRVPVPLPDDPYVAVRQAWLVDIESEPEEAPSKAEELQSLGSRIPLMGEEFVIVESSARVDRGDGLCQIQILYSELILDTDSDEDELGDEDTDEDEEDESLDTNNERDGLDDEDRGLDDEGLSLYEEGLSLEGGEEEAVHEGQQWAAPFMKIAVGEPLGLSYRALRHRELALEEDPVYITFEEGQGFGSVPEPKRPERVSALRQPTLTTWIDLEDGIAYIDVPAYLPPAPPAQTPPSPEWTFGSLPVSLAPSAVPLPILSPMIPLTVPSPIASPVATSTTTISIDEDQFIEERTVVTFGALWRPVLALEAWARHVDTRMEDMSRAGCDDHRLIHDMLVQQAALQRELQEMRGRVTTLEQERDRRER
ncbi:hypothetical protein Tco_0335350 [Tanacetum coccineum]